MEFVRFNNRQSSRQKKLVMTPDLSRRKAEPPAPDLTDFMNDMFFGTLKTDKKVYNLTGTEHTEAIVSDQEDKGKDKDKDREQEDKDKCADLVEESPRRSSTSGRLTQEWLDEARRLVASSPSRCDSPSRLVGSPRFAAAQGSPSSLASSLDRRDPLSRSARRYRAVESFSGEILSKSAKHSRNKSETLATGDSPAPGSPTELLSPASVVHNWFSNIVKPSNPTTPTPPQQNFEPEPRVPTLLSRPSLLRKSRFQTDPSSPGPQGIPTPSGRSSQSGPITLLTETHLLSPPKNLIESAQRRSVSSSTCSVEKIASKLSSNGLPSESGEIRELGLNGFLKERRIKVGKILGGGANAKAKIILSGPSNSTSSMVAAICYAWLLENRVRKDRKAKGDDRNECVMVPVMNVKRETMWKQRQAAWLFYHVGLDVNSLLFANEVDLEGLMMAGKLSMIVIGQDVLRINGEVGSQCTILTDNYCEDAYDLLQTPVLKKLLLAAILLDTQNLNSPSQHSMARDAEAVQLLLVGSTPNYRNTLFDQLIQDQRDNAFLEALRQNYGKPPNKSGHESEEHAAHKNSERKAPSIHHREAIIQNTDNKYDAKTNKVSPKSEKPSSQGPSAPPAKANPDASRGKNKFFLAKWFGFGPK